MADHKQGDDNDVIVKLALAIVLYVIKHLTFDQILALQEEEPLNISVLQVSQYYSMSQWYNLWLCWPVWSSFKEISNPVLVTAEWRPALNPWQLKCSNPSIKPIIQLPG